MVELLVYKALFEMSPNRADFVSNLFSRVRSSGLNAETASAALFAAYENAKADPDLPEKNLQAIIAYMTKHGYQLNAEDLSSIEKIYTVFSRKSGDGGTISAGEKSYPRPPISRAMIRV